MAADLGTVQNEQQAVKKALSNDVPYLGMDGATLHEYLLKLQEKENLLLSEKVHAAGGPAGACAPGARRVSLSQGGVGDVLQHMVRFEAVPDECCKAVRALSSLAYKDVTAVSTNDQAIPQLMRLLTLHPEDDDVQLAVMRALCNIAYDPGAAASHLARNDVLGVLLATASKLKAPGAGAEKASVQNAKVKDAAVQAGEALARIVASEVEQKATATSIGPLASVFVSASGGDPSWHAAVLRLVAQLVDNDVIGLSVIAERLAQQAGIDDHCHALGWLTLARTMSGTREMFPELADSKALVEDLPDQMMAAGAIRAAARLVQRFGREHDDVQLRGIEALSALVGNRPNGLDSFVDAGGVQLIQDGAEHHPDSRLLQQKSIRALASGVGWPEPVRRKAGYDPRRGVEVTVAAMKRHQDSAELNVDAFQALCKYGAADGGALLRLVAELGTEASVKDAMTRHQAVTDFVAGGQQALQAIGCDGGWKPPPAHANGFAN